MSASPGCNAESQNSTSRDADSAHLRDPDDCAAWRAEGEGLTGSSQTVCQMPELLT